MRVQHVRPNPTKSGSTKQRSESQISLSDGRTFLPKRGLTRFKSSHVSNCESQFRINGFLNKFISRLWSLMTVLVVYGINFKTFVIGQWCMSITEIHETTSKWRQRSIWREFGINVQ